MPRGRVNGILSRERIYWHTPYCTHRTYTVYVLYEYMYSYILARFIVLREYKRVYSKINYCTLCSLIMAIRVD